MTRRTLKASEVQRDDLMVASGRRVTRDPVIESAGLVKIRVYNPISDTSRDIELWHDDIVVVERP